jgi:hypothetical protein
MKYSRIVFLSIVFVVYILGLVLYTSGKLGTLRESMKGTMSPNGSNQNKGSNQNNLPVGHELQEPCPNMLIKRGNHLLLYNTGKELKEGINPLIFGSMDEYIQYHKKQKQLGKDCAQLFLQEEYDAQGNQVLRIRPSPFDLGGGLGSFSAANKDGLYHVNKASPIPYIDASRENKPYNQGMYPGFDPISLHEGRYTELDQVHDSTQKRKGGSLNPMDPNWAGVIETQKAINAGVYDENNVSIAVA